MSRAIFLLRPAKLLSVAGILALLASPALAQTPQRVAQSPTPAAITVTASNTFQQALASASRNACFVQYLSANTGWVFFGTTATATTPASVRLTQGQAVSCANADGTVLTDAVQVTGTAGDQFTVMAQ